MPAVRPETEVFMTRAVQPVFLTHLNLIHLYAKAVSTTSCRYSLYMRKTNLGIGFFLAFFLLFNVRQGSKSNECEYAVDL